MNWLDERVEAYVDGALARDERRLFEDALEKDPALREAVALARRVRTDLRAIEAPRCPDAVTEAVLSATSREWRSRPGVSQWLSGLWLPARAWRPALAIVAAIILVVVGLLQPWNTAPEPTYSQADVQEALDEVKWTLAYLNGVGARTGQTIRQEVVADGVVRPVRQGLGIDGREKPHVSN